jgi:hypothetical protein
MRSRTFVQVPAIHPSRGLQPARRPDSNAVETTSEYTASMRNACSEESYRS